MTFPGLAFTEHADGTLTATGMKGSYFICRGKPPNEFAAAYTPHDSIEKPTWGCGAEGACARTEESVIQWCNKIELRVRSRLSVHS